MKHSQYELESKEQRTRWHRMREVGGDLIIGPQKTTPFPHIPEAPTPASLQTVPSSSSKRVPESPPKSPVPVPSQALLYPKHDKLIVPLLLKAAFPQEAVLSLQVSVGGCPRAGFTKTPLSGAPSWPSRARSLPDPPASTSKKKDQSSCQQPRVHSPALVPG